MIVKTLLFLSLSLSLVGCIYLARDKRPGGTVIERNKETRPAWVDSPTNQLLYTTSETRFHFAVLKARDLPIAVKKSQIAAIEASFALWKPTFDKQLATIQEIKPLMANPKLVAEANDLISNYSHKVHSEIAQVEDIYFERVKIENYQASPELEGVSEYFDVHTLVHLNPIDQEKFPRDLAAKLEAANNRQIRATGKQLAKNLNKKSRTQQPKKTGTKAPKKS